MADAAKDGHGRATHLQRQEVLADMHFAPIAEDDELTPSEDEDDPKWQDLELVQSAIGVSIGEQQTRLISPRTPAAEKAAALEGTDGGLFFEGFDAPSDADADTDKPATQQTLSDREANRVESPPSPSPPPEQTQLERLPSPWRAGPRTFQDKTKVNDHRTALKQHLQQGSRRRASSGGSMTEAVRKYMHLNLPSMSKSYKDFHFSLPSFSALSLDGITGPGSSDRRRRGTNTSTTRPSNTIQHSAIAQHDGGAQSTSQISSEQAPSPSPTPTPILQRDFATDSESTVAETPVRPSAERQTTRLRRSNSEGSLLVYRTRSFASSLGDDTRFESVQEQVNNRLKAIRDSWQDANFKFPSPTLPNFNFGSRDDMFKIRNNLPSKPGKADTVLMHNSGTTSRSSMLDLQGAPARPKAKWTTNVPQSSENEPHPFFTQALQEVEGDLVILGGYRGSVLRSAESPHRQLWVPIKVGLNLRKVDLEVPFEADADERMEESIIPSGMLQNIGPIDISKRLFKRLRASKNARSGKLRVHDYGYDWRLSPHLLSRQLIKFLESLPCNQPDVPRAKRGAIVIAHSLGGLITRHAINERPDLVAGVVYAGVPQRCVNILGPFRNGDGVLFSSRVLTAQVNFSIRTSFALLPLDGKCFINKHTKEEYPVDFFDPKTWTECRLSPCLGISTPRPAPKDSNLSVSGIINAMSQALPSFPSRKYSISRGSGQSSSAGDLAKGMADTARNAAEKIADEGAENAGMGPQMADGQPSVTQTSNEPGSATAVTIPYDKAVEYLQRVLPEIKRFKEETAHIPEHTKNNTYPPIALIYGKSTPTVYGAKVESRDTIKRADAYDELAFASGDGVVLARAAMVPDGYSVTRGGVVSSDRGHITLLGDLEAVGRCLHAVIRARRDGVGTGNVAA